MQEKSFDVQALINTVPKTPEERCAGNLKLLNRKHLQEFSASKTFTPDRLASLPPNLLKELKNLTDLKAPIGPVVAQLWQALQANTRHLAEQWQYLKVATPSTSETEANNIVPQHQPVEARFDNINLVESTAIPAWFDLQEAINPPSYMQIVST